MSPVRQSRAEEDNTVVPNRLKEVEAELERTDRQLRLLQRISRLMAKDLRLNETLRSVVGLITEFMGSDSCLVYLLDGHHLELFSSSGAITGEGPRKLSLRVDEGLTGWARTPSANGHCGRCPA